MHTLAAASDYAGSASGYVISVLVIMTMGLVAYIGKRNDLRSDRTDAKIDMVKENHSALVVTVTVLSKTVDMLEKTVRKLPDTEHE